MAGSVQAVVSLLRARGVTVHEWPGWQQRGNGSSPNWLGGIVHHTGSGYGSAYAMLADGRPATATQPRLPGPLCNFAGNEDGSLTVIAAGGANHAGASGGYNTAPLPVTGSFNRLVMGLEIVYPGTSPMRSAQYNTAVKWARAVADVCAGGRAEYIKAHAETSVTGKWDPGYADGKTINMHEFRAFVAAGGILDMELDDTLGKRPNGSTFSVRDALANLYLGAFYGGGDSGPRAVYPTVNAVNTDLGKVHAQIGVTAGQAIVDTRTDVDNLVAAMGDVQGKVAGLGETANKTRTDLERIESKLDQLLNEEPTP